MAVAAACLVLFGRTDDDRLARVRRRSPVDEALRRRRGPTTAVADRLQLVDELGVGQEVRHRPERKPPEVLVETGGDDPYATRREVERVRDDGVPEELHLVDPDHVESLRALGHVVCGCDGHGPHARARVAHDVGRVIAVVDPRLQDDDALSGDLGAAEPADHLLALPAEHRTADDLEPTTSLRRNADHGGDPSEPSAGIDRRWQNRS